MSRGAPSNEWTARQPIRSNAMEFREEIARMARGRVALEPVPEARPACDGLWGRHSPPQGACERCLELETQIVTLKRTAQRLSRQLVGAVARAREEGLATGMAAGVKLAQEVGRAGIELGEAKAMAREAARDDADAAKEREGAGW